MEKTKLLVMRQKDEIISACYEKNRMIQASVEPIAKESILGNIYLGQVKNIVKNINAAFVEYEEGKMCYLSLREDTSAAVFANTKTSSKICEGDFVIVQISKEDVKTKAPVATIGFSFTGKYLVLTHGKPNISLSKKILDEEERKRLTLLLKPWEGKGYGLIVRTNAVGITEEKLLSELYILEGLYKNIMDFGIHKGKGALLYQSPPRYLCEMRDLREDFLEEILTDDRILHRQIREYLEKYQLEDLKKLRLYDDKTLSLDRMYGVETGLKKAVSKQVWLKSGGTLVIEPCEALTVIDVNTGKAVKGNKKVQETFLKINLEAAKEIAFQLRLRNLSGIIIVDFIDLEEDTAKEVLLRELKVALAEDPIRCVVVDMTALGLVEITRKKLWKPLHEQLKHNPS